MMMEAEGDCVEMLSSKMVNFLQADRKIFKPEVLKGQVFASEKIFSAVGCNLFLVV